MTHGSVRGDPRAFAERVRSWPVLRRDRVRQSAAVALQHVRRLRRRAHERLGSDRLSHPSREIEDVLLRYLPQRGGVYVEAGAYDGYFQSSTYWLERFRGWTGVLVEPVPELARATRRERPRSRVVECALVPRGFPSRSIEMLYGGSMSLVSGAQGSDEADHAFAQLGAGAGVLNGRDPYRLTVPARTLSDVLAESGMADIDLLSLDVEGFEASVLRGLNLDHHAPRYIVVEIHRSHEHVRRPEIEAALGDRYVHELQIGERDHLYRRADVRPPSHDERA
jgi:FkbM family methyltransferase